MKTTRFYDAHCHALTLSHPAFLAFIDTLRNRGLENIYAQATSPNYLIGALFFKGGERVRNMFSVMENDVGSIFALMEDDLRGKFATPGDPPPLVAGDRLAIGESSYDRLVLVPLIMDFAMGQSAPTDAYYGKSAAKKVEVQARDILNGIRDYRRSRPDGFLEVRPFLGINTRNYEIGELARVLDAAFSGYRRGLEPSVSAFRAMESFDEDHESASDLRFAGIKVYPPLGFDPWPAGGREREKVSFLYEFCEARDIPITTHCDDQGFRVVSLEEAWTFTSPSRWRKALEAHPRLRLDLAHFGAQYSRPVGRVRSLSEAWTQPTEWRDEIVRLMSDFPRVYTDISFNGSEAGYYESLVAFMAGLPDAICELALDRIMFGSDFLVNLSKVRSYSDYFRIFSASPLPEEWRRKLAHENPERFLTGE
jgi:predicted TIM-barrel fold metal-dependent hydrolase